MNGTLARTGFFLIEQALSPERLGELKSHLQSISVTGAGRRNLLSDVPAVRKFAKEDLAALLSEVDSETFFPVRALLFDKTPEANWIVSWHQDLSIAVKERRDAPGFSGWAMKEGVCHTQPPAALLERMVAMRVHLDDCGTENGPLRVIPGSHLSSRLDSNAIVHWRSTIPEHTVTCRAGDVLLMRPLLLHASSKATAPSHRRVLHVEFASEQLPDGLEWASTS